MMLLRVCSHCHDLVGFDRSSGAQYACSTTYTQFVAGYVLYLRPHSADFNISAFTRVRALDNGTERAFLVLSTSCHRKDW
jgi:hypothetical protein